MLGKNILFNDLSYEERQQLVDDILDEPIYLKSGDFILHEGDPASAMYILFQGNAEAIKKDQESGRYHQLII
ncbi:MAG: hypothetical protein DRR19_00415 [Candidatus Parabeggiatoa sp. nov. 1]|nr:MAG: hypothetical protein DRR19_00415 [Gammaproteobacteria bacterium]